MSCSSILRFAIFLARSKSEALMLIRQILGRDWKASSALEMFASERHFSSKTVKLMTANRLLKETFITTSTPDGHDL